MTHSPPIPAGNQSPYPLQEAPHSKSSNAPPAGDPRVARTPEPPSVPVPTVIALAAGVGLAVIAGGLFWAISGRSKPKPKKKRKAPKPA